MDPLASKLQINNSKMRELPHNIEAEQSLLGAIMLDNECYDEIADIVESKHFFIALNGKIFEAITWLLAHGRSVDPISLKSYFEENENLKDVGGGQYFLQLVNTVISVSNVKHYAQLIHDLYNRRQLIFIGEEIVSDAMHLSLDKDSNTQIEKAESKLYELATDTNHSNCKPFSEIAKTAIQTMEAAFKSENKLVGITSGFNKLDEKLGGLNRSDLIILAGRPSMGKTALATNMGFRIAMASLLNRPGGGKVVLFSLEMSSEQLVSRIIAQETLIPSERIRKGTFRLEDLGKVKEKEKQLETIPLFIEDTPAMTVSSIRITAKRIQRQKGLDLIIIDYLQLIQGRGKSDNRVQEISEITRSLKGLAKELNIPVIALSQLSRAVEMRDDKRPQLADLRESGSIEQDADVVMFVFREEYYLERAKPTETDANFQKWNMKIQEAHNKAEVIIAKQRHGPIGSVNLFFDGTYTKFDNLAI